MASYAKALGHPARIAILESILKKKACVCGDLVDELGLAQATISQHLKALKEVGILQGTIEGPSICYCIDKKAWEEIGSHFNTLLSQIPENENSC
ncbi:DNA-binding helix-turn-helix protein [Leptospira fainei serovar Hurstbridge str. BUT 6]|uniref:DNA-binding helix-turn-helix protein n=2 Tax=Leptospira fainei TaxID=48782 RepID=S3V3R2_9LEPT|nr:metalloregulator ArsR/SmtB family transcription factor [Leptospira fainei]EPG75294.1 DNA-binding helix-turn-helix protein [Leptospira fainei serovar Hurstbridge str. BUT 6]